MNRDSATTSVPTVAVPACPICHQDRGEVCYWDTHDRWFGTPGSWRFKRCSNCHGLWLDPRPSTAALPGAYSNYYTHTATAEHGRRRSISNMLRSRLPWHACDERGAVGYLDGVAPGRVLDLGCGDGSRLARLSLEGWSTVGYDVDPSAIEVASSKVDGDVHVGSVDDIHESAAFDAVVMFHVLEHVERPEETLARALALLRVGGVISVTTPNARSWLHTVYRQGWRALEPPRHLQIFSELGLRELLHQAGFDGVKIFTTERNAGPLAFASERSYEKTRLALARVALSGKAELFQALEWAQLRWSPMCGEELVAIAVRPPR